MPDVPGPAWAGPALHAVLDRAALTRAEVGARFPLFADPATGTWTTTRRGAWTGGFWAGLLWLRARHTGAAEDREAAARCTARLADWVHADTATRGLILWYGTASTGPVGPTETDAAPGADPGLTAEALRARAGLVCLEAVDPGLGLVPWGAAFGGPRLVARADAVPGLVPLLAAAGPRGAEAAAAHLHRHLDLCRAGAMAWRYAPGTGWRPLAEPAPGWSRGRAWLLLAVADALARADSETWRPDRLRRAAAWLGAFPAPGDALVPPADTAGPAGPLDTSAAAITAVALLKLAALPGADAERLTGRATAVLHRLVTAHLTDGRLLDGCYDAATGTAERHELVWGDYFLALGLAALTGLVHPGDV
ncbi:sugar ABC transporter permease [Streptomyces spectabilis]|uniref:Sugar ABC transporter permease n=1 Tax=Streptomyces spectabilis TaxID=68270 RepID=A0A5P2XHZ8_STRST|nr:sugar ABC transporter permease [Streptomyces spectabilis]MCI3905684.1 sugar ABC transporter permease [Streptomyces spectabilis]QEV62640.1 sugar ABC transporter permease [Streptomyces spectabilis]